ncbi:MAG: hypothetical protein JXA42_07455 [Anaerolineales bacterium]|nr:hypothetical protein [Anaerolineales bacterium]
MKWESFLAAGETALIHTGGELPAADDAIVKMEDTRPAGENRVFSSMALQSSRAGQLLAR